MPVTSDKSQSLHSLKVSMLYRHHTSVGKQLFWVVIDQLSSYDNMHIITMTLSLHILPVMSHIHRVSKKLCQHIFCSVLVKYESISIKIGRHVLEDTTNKTVQKVSISPIMSASSTLGNLKWQIELSTQYLHVYFNESLNIYKTTSSYCVENRRTCSKSHHLYIVCLKCLSPARTQAHRRWLSWHQPHVQWMRDSDCSLVFDASSQFLYIWGGHCQHVM